MADNNIIYLIVPNKYYNVYQKLLNALADYGKEILNECYSNNKSSVSSIINCWNLFQTALACEELEQYDKALFYISYINNQLDIVYRNNKINDDPIFDVPEVDSPDDFYTRIYMGSLPNDSFDFDVSLLKEFRKEDTINGKYMVDVNQNNYVWILIPSIYEHPYFTLNSIEIPIINFGEVLLNINNTEIKYNCFRIKDMLNKINMVIEITNL